MEQMKTTNPNPPIVVFVDIWKGITWTMHQTQTYHPTIAAARDWADKLGRPIKCRLARATCPAAKIRLCNLPWTAGDSLTGD